MKDGQPGYRVGGPTNIMEKMWDRMKEEAITWAGSDRPLPTPEQCIEQIGTIAKEVLPQYFSLPDNVRAFYAGEFYGMIAMRRVISKEHEERL